MKPIVAWSAFWVGFGLLDYAADRRGASLCTATRRLFRTDTTVGGLVFDATFLGGALVLHRHVRKVTGVH